MVQAFACPGQYECSMRCIYKTLWKQNGKVQLKAEMNWPHNRRQPCPLNLNHPSGFGTCGHLGMWTPGVRSQ